MQRLIHIRTQYMGPDELLVAAKIALEPGLPLAEVAAARSTRPSGASVTRSAPPA